MEPKFKVGDEIVIHLEPDVYEGKNGLYYSGDVGVVVGFDQGCGLLIDFHNSPMSTFADRRGYHVDFDEVRLLTPLEKAMK